MGTNEKVTILICILTMWAAIMGWTFRTWHTKLENRITTLESETKVLGAMNAKIDIILDMMKDKK